METKITCPKCKAEVDWQTQPGFPKYCHCGYVFERSKRGEKDSLIFKRLLWSLFAFIPAVVMYYFGTSDFFSGTHILPVYDSHGVTLAANVVCSYWAGYRLLDGVFKSRIIQFATSLWLGSFFWGLNYALAVWPVFFMFGGPF